MWWKDHVKDWTGCGGIIGWASVFWIGWQVNIGAILQGALSRNHLGNFHCVSVENKQATLLFSGWTTRVRWVIQLQCNLVTRKMVSMSAHLRDKLCPFLLLGRCYIYQEKIFHLRLNKYRQIFLGYMSGWSYDRNKMVKYFSIHWKTVTITEDIYDFIIYFFCLINQQKQGMLRKVSTQTITSIKQLYLLPNIFSKCIN